MTFLYFVLAVGLVVLVLWEIFETIVLPRKIDRKIRLTRYYYLTVWTGFCFVCDRISHRKVQSIFFSIFGPLSLLGLFIVWGVALIFAFALMHWSIHSSFRLPDGERPTFLLDLYVTGTTITTLGWVT